MNDLLRGKLVRLTSEDPEVLAPLISRWCGDSEFFRLEDWDPARRFSVKAVRDWIEKHREEEMAYAFVIRRLEDDRIIGEVGLEGIKWPHGEAFVGIALGERDLWGQGYGTDAMRIMLRYAFSELNLQRVSLNVFEYNPRAIRSYEKAGFVLEGRERRALHREGRRWDVLYMGILRTEWERNTE